MVIHKSRKYFARNQMGPGITDEITLPQWPVNDEALNTSLGDGLSTENLLSSDHTYVLRRTGFTSVTDRSNTTPLINNLSTTSFLFDKLNWTASTVTQTLYQVSTTTPTSINDTSAHLMGSENSAITHVYPNISRTIELNSMTHQVLVGLVLVLLDIFMLFGNILALITIFSNPSLHCQPKYLLIANLAFADFLWSVLLMPPAIAWEIQGVWMFGEIYCDIYNLFDISLFTISTYSLLLITIDKYIFISRPLTYPSFVKTYRVILIIILVWVLWIIFGSVSVFLHLYKDHEVDESSLDDPCMFIMNKPYAIISGIISFYAPFLTLSILSLRIICITQSHIRKISRVSIPEINLTPFYVDTDQPCKNIYCMKTIRLNKGSPIRNSDKSHQQYNSCDSTIPNILDTTLNDNNTETTAPQSSNASSDNTPKKTFKNPFTLLQERCSSWRGVTLLLSVVVTFTVMVSPYWIATTINAFCDCVPADLYDNYLVYFYYMNPLVNPYIYMVTDRLYRTTMMATIGKHCKLGNKTNQDIQNTNTTVYNETFHLRASHNFPSFSSNL